MPPLGTARSGALDRWRCALRKNVIVKTPRAAARTPTTQMKFASAIAAATNAGMKLEPKDDDIVTPPETTAWKNTADYGHSAGMAAARTAKGTSSTSRVDPCYITKAASMAKVAVHALVLLVLEATVKSYGVSYQIESGDAFRSYALISGASLLRNMACVALCRAAYTPCEALHRLLWAMWEGMDRVKPGISKAGAVHIVLSVTLIWAESCFAAGSPEMVAIGYVRDVLGVTALCGYAAQNTAYHSGKVRYLSPKFQRLGSTPTPSTRSLDGVV